MILYTAKNGTKFELGTQPRIPTYLEASQTVLTIQESGYYAVIIGPDGFEYLSPSSIMFKTFEKCKSACDCHNNYIGMTPVEIAQLYTKHRCELV